MDRDFCRSVTVLSPCSRFSLQQRYEWKVVANVRSTVRFQAITVTGAKGGSSYCC